MNNACNICNYKCQKYKSAHIMFVGLSAKQTKQSDDRKLLAPLSSQTNSGKIIDLLSLKFKDLLTYKTNLVKCAPLNNQNKLRYPNENEMENCFNLFQHELNQVKPLVVVMLGKQVSHFLIKKFEIDAKKGHKVPFLTSYVHNQMLFIETYHPSYMQIYQHKNISDYIEQIYDTSFVFIQ